MKIYQIYFEKAQAKKLVKGYIPYLNEKCTLFFENDVIAKLIHEKAHWGDDYFGVVSHRLNEKVRLINRDFKGKFKPALTPTMFNREILRRKPDALSFILEPPHDPILVANESHPNFSFYWAEVMHKIGYDWKPNIYKYTFYCNYFAAKPEIYEKYVMEMLLPAMNAMRDIPELLNPSRYPLDLPRRAARDLGIDHYPFHPFLCERMFSYFAFIHNLRCW